MHFYMFRMTRKNIVVAVLIIGALLCALILMAGHRDQSKTVFGSEISSKNIKTDEDRIMFLKKLGWEVDADSMVVQDVVIPSEFNETLVAYNQIQLTQGCDLTRYAGKRVKRYTYDITNYPTGEMGVKVSLLIYNNTVIGGDICSTRLDGFMHGLTFE